MQTELHLQTEKCYYNLESILGALSNFDDEDFNGNNGEEYLWEEAEGYECNQDYVLDQLRAKYTEDLIHEEFFIVIDLVNDYFNDFLGRDGYYLDYKIDVDIEDGNITIACAWISGS